MKNFLYLTFLMSSLSSWRVELKMWVTWLDLDSSSKCQLKTQLDNQSICIQSDEILFKIYDALIDLLLCSFKSTFCLKVANFRIVKFSMQVFSIVLSVKFLIMIAHAHYIISSLIAKLLWQVWCKSLQLLLFHDEIKWYHNYEVFAVLQSEHQEVVVHDALLFKLMRLISMLTCIILIVIIVMLILMIKD